VRSCTELECAETKVDPVVNDSLGSSSSSVEASDAATVAPSSSCSALRHCLTTPVIVLMMNSKFVASAVIATFVSSEPGVAGAFATMTLPYCCSSLTLLPFTPRTASIKRVGICSV